jgi:hypothetical protein
MQAVGSAETLVRFCPEDRGVKLLRNIDTLNQTTILGVRDLNLHPISQAVRVFLCSLFQEKNWKRVALY